MENSRQKISYFLYARKSTESEDRQVQSIDDQAKELTQLAKRLGLHIKGTFTESKSSKKPFIRPVFDEMMEKIEAGEANGILCWKLDRLSRNPVDSGRIAWALQQGILKAIQAIDKEYLPEDNVLLFAVESGVANQYILDLRRNVRRGINSKLEKGWSPNIAPLGYLNEPIERTIVEDPDRFPLIRKMFDMMLTGTYTPPKILEIVNKQWGFRTRRFKRSGDKPLARSGIYKIFTNPFYAGIITYSGKEYIGKHKPVVTAEEFDRVQYILGRKGKPRPKKHAFALTGLILCGECGCLYTAETKKKLIKGTGEVRFYTYYHCTHKRTDIDCSQRRCIREDALERQVLDELAKYTILPEFRDWALEILRQSNDKEIEARTKVYEMQHKTLEGTQCQLDELTRMRYRGQIDDETFTREKADLQSQITKLRSQVKDTEARADNWLELTERTFDFALYAAKAFATGDLQTKKEILMAIGQNPTIKDGKLSITANAWLQPIAKDYPPLEIDYLRSEPAQLPINKKQTEALASVRTSWLRD